MRRQRQTKKQSVLVDVIFTVHLFICLFFPLGFFIPSRVWPERIEVHFWISLTLFILFYLWGGIWTLTRRDRVYAVCVLDTFMQRLRGYKLSDPRNFDHSFVEELFERFNIRNVSKKTVPGMLLGCILLSGILYVLKTQGIVLY